MTWLRVTAEAHPNVALAKYWGKIDDELNLPAHGSISIALAPLRARTAVRFGMDRDSFALNGAPLDHAGAVRAARVIDAVRRAHARLGFSDPGGAEVSSVSDLPLSAGLASSSAGFAALAVAASAAAGLQAGEAALSGLARLGSGSACRSVPGGFAEWLDAARDRPGESVAVRIAPPDHWDLRVLIAVVDDGRKRVSSSDGMRRCRETSPLYPLWVEWSRNALAAFRRAVLGRDFPALTALSAESCRRMHECCAFALPRLRYATSGTMEVTALVERLAGRGIPVFHTIDAGPNVKVFTLADHEESVAAELGAAGAVLRVIRCAVGGPSTVVGMEEV